VASSGVLGSIQQRLKPRAARTAQRLVDPVYARRDELAAAIGDIQRLLADQLAAEEEATAVFGRVLAELAAKVDALHDEIARLAERVDGAAVTSRRKR
jgi:ubiquinone biosynthesis protein UbiJ